MPEFKAIETAHGGYLFRSRIEARWAIFFETLGVSFEYEKEGFEFPDGTRYLPDFWLEQQQCWFEVKGKEPTEADIHKMKLLVEHTHQKVFIASGPIPNIEPSDEPFDIDEWLELHEHDDFSNIPNLDMILYCPEYIGTKWEILHHGGGLCWCECPTCHRVGIRWFTLDGHNKYFCQCTEVPVDDSPRILRAFDAARMARFEHGKHGN